MVAFTPLADSFGRVKIDVLIEVLHLDFFPFAGNVEGDGHCQSLGEEVDFLQPFRLQQGELLLILFLHAFLSALSHTIV